MKAAEWNAHFPVGTVVSLKIDIYGSNVAIPAGTRTHTTAEAVDDAADPTATVALAVGIRLPVRVLDVPEDPAAGEIARGAFIRFAMASRRASGVLEAEVLSVIRRQAETIRALREELARRPPAPAESPLADVAAEMVDEPETATEDGP